MGLDVLHQAPKTPARSAAIRSMELAMAGDGKAWLELFADDAVVQDPYGVSPMDPEGKGHRGKAAIEAFCANHIRPGAMRFQIRQTLTSGDACVCIGTITTRAPDGNVGWCEVVNVYEVNAEGKISLLRSYWDFDAMTRTVF